MNTHLRTFVDVVACVSAHVTVPARNGNFALIFIEKLRHLRSVWQEKDGDDPE